MRPEAHGPQFGSPNYPAIRDGDRDQPMRPELEALVGSPDARDESPCGVLAALAE
jgi:hypothetical protein